MSRGLRLSLIALATAGGTAAVLLGSGDVRSVGAALLLWLLPGLAVLEWTVPAERMTVAERLALGVGLSLALSPVAGLLVHWLPGPLAQAHALAACLSPIAVGLGGALFRPIGESRPQVQGVGLGLLTALLLVAGVFRMAQLGYAEFQGDEALVTWASARAIAGADGILYEHGKSPAEVLLPAMWWSLDGRLNESTARLPFALGGLAAVIGGAAFAGRLFGRRAAWIAGALFAINGYFVAFSRVVQYQSLVIVFGMLAVYTAYRSLEEGSPGYRLLSGVLLGSALLAHYDGFLVVPVVGYLWLLAWMRHRGRARASVVGAVLLAILVASIYYVPFLAHPQFGQTASYLGGSRLGGGLLNNNLTLLFLSGSVYNSSYYVAIMAAGLLAAIWWAWPRRSWGWVAALALTLALGSAVAWPDVWQAGPVNLAAVPFLAATIPVLLSTRNSDGSRAVWLWLVVTFTAYVFVLGHPLSHVYVILPAWCLLAAWMLDRLLGVIEPRVTDPFAAQLGVGALVVGFGFLAFYPYAVFVRHTPEFRQGYFDKPVPGFWRPYEKLPGVGKFGFPHRSGWKALGLLYEQGILSGDWRSNEEEWVPLWYTRLQPRSCGEQSAYYFLARNAWDASETPADLERDYAEIAQVSVEGERRIRIFARKPVGPLGSADVLLPVIEDTVAAVDYNAGATPDRYVQKPRPDRVVETRLDGRVDLLGYDLVPQPIESGRPLALTLYWRAELPTSERYHVFVHLAGGAIAQADSEPVCGRLPTTQWQPGQIVGDRHVLNIPAGTPPGRYPLTAGLWDPLTGRRLPPAVHGDGQDAVLLGEVEVR